MSTDVNPLRDEFAFLFIILVFSHIPQNERACKKKKKSGSKDGTIEICLTHFKKP